MKTAAEYRALAEECFKWAREAKANEVRVSLKQLAQVWLDAASKLDGAPPSGTQLVPNQPKPRVRPIDGRRSGRSRRGKNVDLGENGRGDEQQSKRSSSPRSPEFGGMCALATS
jgi:hypothetical protein